MTLLRTIRRPWLGGLAATAVALPLAGGLGTAAHAQETWKPERSIEWIVPSGPGAALDNAARRLASIMERNKIVDQTIVVVNRSGAAGSIALQAAQRHTGGPHVLTTFTTGMLNARAIGAVSPTYEEFTPIAVVLEESLVVAVKKDSPVRDAKDLAERLKKDPEALSIGLATAVGNHIHVGIAKPLQAAGVDISRLRTVPFRSSSETQTSLVGGHIDVMSSSSPSVIAPLQADQIRVLATVSGSRLHGALSSVPTWKELGVDAEYSSVQGVLGAKDLTPAQRAFWEQALRAATETAEWKEFVQTQNWKPLFMGSKEMKPYLEEQFALTKTLINDLKLTNK